MATMAESGTGYFWEHGGELGRLIRAKDWSKTPLGPIESWPQSLRTAVGIMLTSRQPIWIGWGESLIYLYNDPYKSIIGGKHPHMLGQPTAVVWHELWDVIGPMLKTAMSGDQGTYVESQLLIMERHGFREETYYTFSYSAIPDDDGRPGGIICANTDDTQRRIGDRQLALVRELAAKTANARTAKEACEQGAAAMGSNDRDLPFAMIYLQRFDGAALELAGASGIAPGHPAAPRAAAVSDPEPWPFAAALQAHDLTIIDVPASLAAELPTGAWDEAPTKAALLPISAATGPGGLLVVGLNPFRLVDDGYRNFLTLVGRQIAATTSSAHAYEEERRHAEALSELDRAKTAFFSNVSHEFRTPLTLILGPSEELLSGNLGETNEIQRAYLTTLQRNAVRLQKLVNTLLDFARVEAGRIEANYEPVDVGLVTRDLASTFCSAVHRAGLLYIMNCPSIDAPVYVDRDMWEKIVLNLLSNALKFTLEGMVEVSVLAEAESIKLIVRDTGAGIPKHELPRLFDRFHRVLSSRSRTQEGSGIGLALVQELVRLHGGSIDVESELDKGTTFTVSIPKGIEHLPKERVGAVRTLNSTALGATPFVEEALSWLPSTDLADQVRLPVSAADLTGVPLIAGLPTERILIADDNPEMRNYLKRLLETRWEVTVVEDGAKALAIAKEQRPDLVLSDVMMPGLTGFELLHHLREDAKTSSIPVILLSARAGDEAYIEGMSAGADDYIVKPFGARELIARVKALLEVTRVRRDSERRVTSVLESITDGFQVFDKDWRLTYMNSEAKRVFAEHGIDPEWAIGKRLWKELFPEDKDSESAAKQRQVMNDRVPASFEKYYGPWKTWYAVRAYPLPEGGVANYFQDITEYRAAEEAKARLAAIIESSTDAIVSKDLNGVITSWNYGAERLFGYAAAEAVGQPVNILIPADRLDEEPHILERIRRGERIEHYETIRRRKDGILRDISLSVSPIFDNDHRVIGASKIARDITEAKRAEEALRRSEERFRTMADSSPVMIWMTDSQGNLLFLNRTYLEYCGIKADEAKTYKWTGIIHPEERDAYVTGFRKALQNRETFYHRVRLRRHDGQWRWVESRGNPILDQGGKMVAFIGSSPDITDIYESQQALKELGQRKDEFLANMSHEIRSPLTGIMGYADILLSRLTDPDDLECLRTIKESGDYLIEIVNDILDLAKIEAGKLVLAIEPVGIHAMLSEVQTLMALRARQKGIALRLRYDGALPESIQTDRTRLRQILINLVSNGIKFTDRGRVDIVARAADGLLKLEVIDTGIGMAPEHQKILFQPFTQADTSSTRHYSGTGLGLTITKRLVEMLDGTISFESERGKGSAFRVSVPMGADSAETSRERSFLKQGPPVAADGLLRGKRVLVVDDREEICYLVSRYIREAGGQTEEATDGEAALSKVGASAASVPFDAMVLDIHMPGMDGYEVVRQLRDGGSSIPIIALTAGAMIGDREKCLEAGFDDYLTKPIDRQKLVQLVAEHAQAHAAESGDGKNLRVLMVDDSHNACTFLTHFLENRGYEVRAVHDGQSALAAAREFRPSVIVLDIRLPDMNGFQLMERLKRLEGVAGARFIGLSGYRDDDEPGAKQFDHFLEKPVDTAQLQTLLRELVG